jgi:hypothetical protein
MRPASSFGLLLLFSSSKSARLRKRNQPGRDQGAKNEWKISAQYDHKDDSRDAGTDDPVLGRRRLSRSLCDLRIEYLLDQG